MIRITFLLSLMCLMTAQTCEALDAPNVVPINDHLITSGQPTRESLALLGSEGFQAVPVSCRGPGDVKTPVRTKQTFCAGRSIEFVHVPIVFPHAKGHERSTGCRSAGSPRRQEGAGALPDQHARLHGHLSLPARAIKAKTPRKAFESVTQVWVPEGAWKQLVIDVLAARGVDFDPF